MRSLVDLKKGDEATIKKLEGGKQFQKQARTMGLKEEGRIRVIAIEPFGGPIVIKTHNTTITLGRGKAEKIIVEE